MSEEEADLARERKEMVRRQIKGRRIQDELVLEAMRTVPRHRFVPAYVRGSAYRDAPLPIGEGQTISQPYVVAFMTEALQLSGGEKVLEIGTGSGYQAAVLALIAGEVISVERLPRLAEEARRTLAELGYDNVRVVVGDGTQGWPEEAPYDAIMVTAASPEVPAPLLQQLADGGRLVAPVGPRHTQQLVRVRREGEEFRREDLLGVAFVPLIGEHGWDKRGSVHWWEEEAE
ncbi:MAG: protein-L-isoaspartate(D-aspartate) O-methyltransferase [Anaerolineae bacterium]|jgi:protein-L-isoaspartate(D-aspartate) O-methyltransferase